MLSPASNIYSDASEDDEAVDLINELDTLDMDIPDYNNNFVDSFLESTGNSTITQMDFLASALSPETAVPRYRTPRIR